MLDRDQVRDQAVATATRLCRAGGKPAGDGIELSDLDSFTIVEMVIALEDRFSVPLLLEIGQFTGTTFAELADFIIVQCDRGAGVRAG